MKYRNGFYVKLVFENNIKIMGPYSLEQRNTVKLINNEISLIGKLSGSKIRYAYAVKNSEYAGLWEYRDDGFPCELRSNGIFAYVDGIRYAEASGA